MNRISTKILAILAVFTFIALIPTMVSATNENISIIDQTNAEGKQEYIIYIKDFTSKEFKYALSNNANPEEMDLVYINSITDLGENQVAFINAETYEKLSSQTVYIWAKDENDNVILKGVQLDFKEAIDTSIIDTVETTTERIKVNTELTQSTQETTTENVLETRTNGAVEITDSKSAEYYYQNVKLPNGEYTTLMELAEKIQKEYDGMDIYSQIQLATEFYDLYTKLINQASWEKVADDMVIQQPSDSKDGEQYVLFLKKVSGNDVVLDAQFLTCYDDYTPTTEKTSYVTQETTRLPITYDSIVLVVVLAVIVVLAIIVFIRMKKLNKDEEKK